MSASLAGLRTLNTHHDGDDDDDDENDDENDNDGEKDFEGKTRTPGLSPDVLSQGLVALLGGLEGKPSRVKI